MSKKALIIIILIIIVLAIGGYAYYALFMKQGTPLTPVTTQTGTNPFPVSGQNSSTTRPTTLAVGTTSIDSTPAIVHINAGTNSLVQLTTEPVSGFTTVGGISTTSPHIRYVEQKSGHVFDIDLSSYMQNRISNTTLPNIAEALFTTKGDQGIFRYLKENTETIESYFFTLSTSSLSAGYYLPEDIKTLTLSPVGTKIFYITNGTTGAQGTIDNRDTKKKSSVFSSSFSDWTVAWPSDTTITLTTRPSSGILGYLYFLSPATGSMKPILNGVFGLTTLTNPTATTVLFSDDTNSLFLLNVKTSTSTNLGLFTRAEKCVWSKRDKNIAYCAGSSSLGVSGTYPDDWYQGVVSFSDDIYKINVATHSVSLLVNIHADYKQDIDITDLVLSPTENYIAFKNKSDGTLWSLKLP